MAAGQSKLSKTRCCSQEKNKRYCLQVGCWNMRMLVESEGRIETSVARPGGQEAQEYKVNLAGISETK